MLHFISKSTGMVWSNYICLPIKPFDNMNKLISSVQYDLFSNISPFAVTCWIVLSKFVLMVVIAVISKPSPYLLVQSQHLVTPEQCTLALGTNGL